MFGRGKGERGAREVYLSAFGKHPGWDDHIEDIGIETDQLASLKQLLYVQGIGGTIDSGAWDNLTDSQRTQAFRHVFVCRTGGDVIVGRLWSSTDGKGRARYPMVVCAQCAGLSLPWVLREMLPRLEALQERCVGVSTAGEVIAVTDQARRECRDLAAAAGVDQSEFVVSPQTVARLADRPEMGPNHEGLLRILYQIEREMSPYLRANFAAAARNGELRPVQMRVPACGDVPADVILQWFDFLFGQLDPGVEVWTIARLDRPWVDIFVGEPAPQQFFCFQASREALPLASEIPYTLDEEFIDRSRRRIEASRAGTAEPIVVDAEAPIAPKRARRESIGLLERLSSARWRSSLRIVVIVLLVAAVVLAVLIGVITLRPAAPPAPPPRPKEPAMAPADADAWNALCTTFYEWFGSFLADLDRNRLERWRQDAHLREHVLPALEQVQAGSLKLDPRRLADVVGSNLRFMGRNPPKRARNPEVVARTREALATVRAVERNLGPEGWVTLKRLKGLAGQYGQRGWRKQAGYVASVVAQVVPGADLAGKVDTVVAAAAKVEALEASWSATRKQAQTLEGCGSPLLAKFRQYVLVETRTEAGGGAESDLDDMAKRLRKIHASGSRLVAYVRPGWQDRLDMEMVRNKPPVAEPSDPNALKGGDLFQEWLAAIQSEKYQALGAALDLRSQPWKQKQQGVFTAISEMLGKLRDEHKDPNAPLLAKKLEALQTEYRSLCSRKWSRKNKEKIEQEVAAFEPKPAELNEKVSEILLGNIGGVAKYVETLPPTISTASAAINQTWQTRLKDITKTKALAALRAKEKKLRTDLGRLGSELQIALPDKGADKDWVRELSGAGGALMTRREDVLRQALAALTWRDNEIVRSAAFEAKWKALREAFDAWRREAADLAAAFTAIKAALNAGAQLDEKVQAPGGAVGALYARWRSRPIWKEPGVAGVFRLVTRRLDHLEALAKQTDHRELLQEVVGAVGGRFEAARAAWRRLGALPGGWPANPKEFHDEVTAHRSLAAAFAVLQDAGRKKQLQDELVAGTRRRWEAYVEARKNASEVDDAIDSRKDFYVTAESVASLKPINQFRIKLHDFRRAVLGSPAADDKRVKKDIDGFLAAVAALPGGVGSKPPVAALVAEMKKITVAGDAGADLTKGGPGASVSRVQAEASPDGSHVRYAWATPRGQRHSLAFVRVEPKGHKVSYLCTTEVSVGLFLDVATSKHNWPDVRKLLVGGSGGTEEEPRYGAQTWQWADGRKSIRQADLWQPLPAGYEKETLFYFLGAKVGKPGAKHPVQYVSPQAALYFARKLGCRLPSPEEWTFAQGKYGKSDGSGRPNLRDQTWKDQRDHVQSLISGGKIGGFVNGYYPDSGVFWPADVKVRNEREKATALDGDDGVLWFAAVDADGGKTFHHLVGNVAEFTYAAPEDLEKLKANSAADVDRFFRAHANGFHVIGGSALSPPEIKPETPGRLSAKEAVAAYSDVGFRLAFTAPAEPRSARLRRLLVDSGYLSGSAAK